jgi:hypothetical protein
LESKDVYLSWKQWYKFIILATQEAEAGVEAQPSQQKWFSYLKKVEGLERWLNSTDLPSMYETLGSIISITKKKK